MSVQSDGNESTISWNSSASGMPGRLSARPCTGVRALARSLAMQREERAPEPAAAEPAAARHPRSAWPPRPRRGSWCCKRTAGNHAMRQMLSRAEYASDSGLNQGDWN